MRILEREGITFDDVLLLPCYSSITSRFNGKIDLSTQLCPQLPRLPIPILSANMDTITELSMALKISELGGAGIIHRFMPPDAHAVQLSRLTSASYRIACIGVGEDARQRMIYLEPYCNCVLIDIAHGGCQTMVDQIRWVKDKWPTLPVIAGNIVTYDTAWKLIEAGADCLKIGVGNGGLCVTRIKTGCGVPQLTAITEVLQAVKEAGKPIGTISDGGIRSSGDVVKALAAGADAVMTGGLLAGTSETPGRCYHDEKGQGMYKIYRGMASKTAQEDWKGYATSVEGEMRRVPYRGPVEEIFKELVSGILSGMSYLNASDLDELRKNAVFIRQTSNGYRESTPHGL